MTIRKKYFILTESQCSIGLINLAYIKLQYCHGDHIRTERGIAKHIDVERAPARIGCAYGNSNKSTF